jgi:AsmA protein
LVILAKTLITPEKIREAVVPLIEKQLHRKVAVGRVDIGLFSGVALQDIKIQQREAEVGFLSTESVQLHYQLWPLLQKKVVVDQITLVGPQLTIRKNSDGTFNFSDLFGKEKKETGPVAQLQPPAAPPVQVAAPQTPVKSSSQGSALALLVSSVSIEKGQVTFIDESISSKEPVQYLLQDVSFKASGITLNDSFPFQLSALFNETSLRVEGKYNVAKQEGEAKVDLQPLQLTVFSPYLQALPAKLQSALLSLSVQTDFSKAQISLRGNALVDKIDLTPAKMPQAALQQAKVQSSFDVLYSLAKQSVDVSTLALILNGIELGAKGALGLQNKTPQVDLAIQLSPFELDKLTAALPAGLVGSLGGYKLMGTISGKAILKGAADSGVTLVQTGSVQFTDASAEVNGKRAVVNGDVTYDGKKLDGRQLPLQYAEQQMQCDLSAADLFSKPIKASAFLTAEHLDVNAMLPETPKVTPEEPTGEKKAAVPAPSANNQPPVTPPAVTVSSASQANSPKQQEAGPFDIDRKSVV